MQAKFLTLIFAVALARGGLTNVDPLTACSRACNACTCLPTEPPTECSAIDAEGTLLPHEHCNKFYICSHGAKVTFDCFGDLLFNPLTGQCDYEHNVVCGDRVIPEKENKIDIDSENVTEKVEGDENLDIGNENGSNDNSEENGTCNCNPSEAPSICKSSKSDGILVAHEVCTKYFICAHGIPTVMSCPKGLLYNPYTEECDWSYKVQCGDRIIITEDNEVEVENGNGDSENNVESGNCNCNPDEAPLICAVEGSDSTLVANEICNKYYICAHGVPTIMSCPNSLLYNPYTEKCDWPDKVECGDRIIIIEEEKVEEDNGNGDSEVEVENGNEDNENNVESGNCNCNPDEAPLICAVDGSDGKFVANEVCNRYFVCAHGVPIIMSCPKGLLYNPYTEKCDWPDEVECGDRIIIVVEEGDENSENGDNDNENSGDNDSNVGVCNCDPAEAPSICSNEKSDGTLVAHEVCCNFYVCSNGVPVTLSCPFGLLYNPHTEECDWPQNVECGERIVVEVEEEHQVTENESVDNDTCNCNPAEAASICSAANSDGALIAHEVCCWFYKCDNGIATVHTCPSGLMYNPYTEECDWPHNVDCGERVQSEEEVNGGHGEEDSPDGTNDNDIPDEETQPETDLFVMATAKCVENESDGQMAINQNCHQFYVCFKQEPVVLSCPLGLFFDDENHICDWPNNVQCGSRIQIIN